MYLSIEDCQTALLSPTEQYDSFLIRNTIKMYLCWN